MQKVGGIFRGALSVVMLVTVCVWAGTAVAATGVQRTAKGLSSQNDSVFPATVVVDGIQYGRTRVVWSSSKLSGRKTSYAVTYSFGEQVQGVKAPSTIRALYYDRSTNTNVMARLSFIRQTSSPTAPATKAERFLHVSANPDLYPLFAGARLPFSSAAPDIAGAGVSDALLASMYYDPATYAITGSRWDGPQTVNGKQYGRWAVYTLKRTGMAYSAIYAADVRLPDTRVYDGVAHYSSDATAVAVAIQAATPTATPTATATTTPGKPAPAKPRSIWPLVAGAAAAIAALGLVVFWYKRRKKRFDDEDDEEFDEDAFHDPDATEE